MRNVYLVFTFILFVAASCTKEQSKFTKEQVDKKADSIFMTKLPYLKKEARGDFENRLPIELKVKVDSILNKNYEIPSPPELKEGIQIDSLPGKELPE